MKKYQCIYWEKHRQEKVLGVISNYLGGYMEHTRSIGVFLDDDQELHKQHTFEMQEFLSHYGIEDWKNNALTIGTKNGGAVAIGEIVMYMDKKTTRSKAWKKTFIFRDIYDNEIDITQLSLDGVYEFFDEMESWSCDDERYSYTPDTFIKL